MHIQAITLFPEMFKSITDAGITSRALRDHLWHFTSINPRSFADNALGYIDDKSFGGGPGMVMMAPPIQAAIDAAYINCPTAQLIYLSPQGQRLNHKLVSKLSQQDGLILLCGRYEGIDERIIEYNDLLEVSVGDFVVSGGELPAMILMDAVLRLLPGVVGDSESIQQDSFAHGLLDYPHYTRPVEFRGMTVPDVLRSGNHTLIARWRLTQSLKRTLVRRPDLLSEHALTPEESSLLHEIQQEERDIPL